MNPFPEWVERLWNAWDIRVLVLLSLTLQVSLFLLGSRRRYVTGIWIRVIVWSAYLIADWVATVALGKLSNVASTAKGDTTNIDNTDNSVGPNNALRALWAPLLLLHLGGPDTITAYSMEDNQLWLRHLLGLVIQVGVAVYVFLKCWSGSPASVLAFLVFVAGITNYGERTRALWSTNSERPPQKTLMDDYKDINLIRDIPYGLGALVRGFLCLHYYKPHVASYVCSDEEMFKVRELLFAQSMSTGRRHYPVYTLSRDSFQVIAYEVGFLYDVLYTKAPVIFTTAGCILRSISFVCTASVLLRFSAIVKGDEYSNVDVFITYSVLLVAVLVDVYAVVLFFYSDWALLWMIKHRRKPLVNRILEFLAPLSLKKWKRWSNSMAQLNLLNFCLHESETTVFIRMLKFLGMDEKYRLYRCQTRTKITEEFEIFMIEQMNALGINGQLVLALDKRDELMGSLIRRNLKWTMEVNFDQSVIIWHVATDMCYYLSPATGTDPHQTAAKLMSDYMMYLLVEHPNMLSIGTWNFMFKHTHSNIMEILQARVSAISNLEKHLVCQALLQPEPEFHPELPYARSALKDARRLVTTLMGKRSRWKIISEAWTVILCYAAAECQVNHHLQELRRGGEFLTHVWLLLANCGITERSIKTLLRIKKQALPGPHQVQGYGDY